MSGNGWDGNDRRGSPPMPREVGRHDRRTIDAKTEALLDCIEFSGVDLLDPDDKRELTERFARARRVEIRRKRWQEKRAAVVVWIISAFGTVVVSLWLPEALKWIRSKL
jgi:hypothetical protein